MVAAIWPTVKLAGIAGMSPNKDWSVTKTTWQFRIMSSPSSKFRPL